MEQCIENTKLSNDMLRERDVSLFMNYSMFTQIEEVDLNRHLNATFIEFLECIVRCIEKSSPIPLKKGNLLDSQMSFQEVSKEERISMPLQ